MLGPTIKENFIRIILPCDDLNFCRQYLFFKISFYQEIPILHYVSAKSIDYNGIQIYESDSVELKKKDMKSIMNQMDKNDFGNNFLCLNPGNPYLFDYKLESDYHFHLISHYCENNRKKLSKILKAHHRIFGILRKYFKKLR